MTKDSLGDRIKRYENAFRFYLPRRQPLIVRVDGRAFHTLTRNLATFHTEFMTSMVTAAVKVAEEMQGFKVGYVQSDEATFCLTDYDTTETNSWFDSNLQKIVSIAASLMSAHFNDQFYTQKVAVFDGRAFIVPIDDVANVFLWRAKDWQRNSLQMYSRSFFSHKELHKKNSESMHEMLYLIGKSWTKDLSNWERNGCFLFKTDQGITLDSNVLPTYEAISEKIDPLINCKNY